MKPTHSAALAEQKKQKPAMTSSARNTDNNKADATSTPHHKRQRHGEEAPQPAPSANREAASAHAAHSRPPARRVDRRHDTRPVRGAPRHGASSSSSHFQRPQHDHRGPHAHATPHAPASAVHNGRPAGAALASSSSASSGTPSPSASTTSKLYHPFRANFNDHFETSAEALQDVLPFVNELRQLLRPSTPERLTIYDPYYCAGAVVPAWNALGVQHVLHENRDFYVDVAKNTVPGPYDILVTNPPFSDDHIWRLLEFLATQRPLKPWAFVAPDYIASKPQYKAWVEKYFTPTTTVPSIGPAGAVKGAVRRPPPPIPSIESILPPFLLPPEEEEEKEEVAVVPANTETAETAEGEEEKEKEVKDGTTAVVPAAAAAASSASPLPVSVGPEPFYIIPRVRYDYAHPLDVGHEHSHFKSMWYVWAGRHTSEVLRGVAVALSGRGRNAAPSRPSSSAATASSSSAPVSVVGGYQALVEGHHVAATDRRMNPERRQRVAPARGGRGGRRW